MSGEKTLEERLADLTKVYVASLPKRMAQIEVAGKQWADSEIGSTGADPEALKALHNEAHKLTGSAATYGFPDLGNIARDLEIACQQQMGDAYDGMDPPGVPAIMALIENVAKQLNIVTNDAPLVGTETEAASTRNNSNPVMLVTADTKAGAEVRARMSDYGYQATVYATPEALLHAAESRTPVAIIIDGELEGDTVVGAHFVQGIKASYEGVPEVIFVSPRDDQPARQAVTQAGFEHFLLGPLDAAVIIDVLETAIEGKRTA
ncbi:MAG: hypothetical protein HN644_02190 [Rhodospirillales bacterium]|nr:hypothetical protein [Rhodospirillales bacterium]MBT5351541.1 hypothetical protein [Rhodospirillales bacterium]MBT7505061.1 hypothetical protein [Rhodospirillales bacterium]MBT7779466.1 hypothetical protein [Rhodospirillales bacterium]